MLPRERQRLTLVDTSDAIARQLGRVLDTHDMRAPADAIARPTRLCSTSDGAHLRTLAAALLGLESGVETVSIASPSTAERPAQPA